MSRLVVVSNRVAVPSQQAANTGGLAVALREALQANGGVWFGWSGKIAQRTSAEPALTEVAPVTYATVDLGRKDHSEYYNGFANRTLWPLFHYRLDLAEFPRRNYEGYLRVNTLFAEQLRPLLGEDDDIWIHDYHMIPLASELRRLGVRQRIGFFLHTPFPALEVFLALPSHERIARSLCAYDVVGFQTRNDLRAFLDYIVNESGGEVLEDGLIRAYGRTLKAAVFPIGVEAENLARTAAHALKVPAVRRFRDSQRDRAFLMGVDRLDYSKGIPERFEAFRRFLEKYPAWHRQVVMVQIAPGSRTEVPEYKQIRAELEARTGQLNGAFADYDWTPLRYLNKGVPRETLVGFFRLSAAGLVTPLRDGMNLVAKEYVCAQSPHEPGVLILSRFAGAARELDAALLVNPFDPDGVADAIARALNMSMEERVERWEAMIKPIRENSLDAWRDSFLKALRAAPYAPPGEAGDAA